MKDRKVSLISAIAFLILGIIIFLNPEMLIKVVSYSLGGLLILIGVYKCLNYYIQDKRLGIVNRHEMAFGITSVVLGILFIFLASTIELLLRFIVGGWVLIAGLNKIFRSFYTTERNSKYYALLVVGVLLIGIGLYIIFVSNLALSIIGLFMMLYGIIDIISFFVYKDKVENVYEEIETEIKIEETKDKKEIIIETEFEEKKDKNSKKNKK